MSVNTGGSGSDEQIAAKKREARRGAESGAESKQPSNAATTPELDIYYEALLDLYDLLNEQTVPSRKLSAEQKIEAAARRVEKALEAGADARP